MVYSETPFNGNAPLAFLVQEFITANDVFFSRNHGTIPQVNKDDFRLTVNGMVKQQKSWTLDELIGQFPKVEVMATLQCAGNRRHELMETKPIPNELPWGAGAISNATWGGVRLRDVLIAAGFDRKARHIAFSSLDSVQRQGKTFGFGGSIPMEKAMLPETLLAYEMNGEALPALHGYPLRVIVPGYIGARSVKWVTTISAQMEPSQNYFQQRAYKIFPPEVGPDSVKWEDGIMLGENSLNAVICYPTEDEILATGTANVLGYTLGDGHHLVERIEVSSDEGKTWSRAKFLSDTNDLWAWRLWEAEVEVQPGTTHILARATDTAGNTQPEDMQEIWNFKGYANNAWHRVKVQVT
ncbi:MAG: molybdopterin-dependent oxidoreductase [Anaerolineae bacterium]|nr:molybdopterin-dependent oxidoreductase [Anaerolineae bacterium]